jgi:hypothetical protein
MDFAQNLDDKQRRELLLAFLNREAPAWRDEDHPDLVAPRNVWMGSGAPRRIKICDGIASRAPTYVGGTATQVLHLSEGCEVSCDSSRGRPQSQA